MMFNNIWGHVSYLFVDFFTFIVILLVLFVVSIFSIYRIYKSESSNTRKKVLIALVFSIFSFALLYSGFEAYFRYKFDLSDSLGFLKVTGRWDQRHVVYNNYQYRDKNFNVEKNPGIVRIGVMGDSNTFGYGIKNPQNRFSNILEKKLKDHGYHAEVYNFGVSGLGTQSEIKEYERVKQFNFDILVWQYFLNDAQPDASNSGTMVLNNAHKESNPIVSFLSNKSFFFDYVYWRYSAKYNSTFVSLRAADLAQYSNKPVFDLHKQQIYDFMKRMNEEKRKVVVAILPFFYSMPNYPAVSIHKEMRQIFTDDGAAIVVDILDDVKGKKAKDLIVGPYDSHPNETVHRIIANRLYNAIVSMLENTDGKTVVKE